MKLHKIESVQSFPYEGKVYLIFNNGLCKNVPDSIPVKETEEVVIRTDNPYIHNDHHLVVVEHGNHFYIMPRIDDTMAEVLRIEISRVGVSRTEKGEKK